MKFTSPIRYCQLILAPIKLSGSSKVTKCRMFGAQSMDEKFCRILQFALKVHSPTVPYIFIPLSQIYTIVTND